MAGVIDDRVIQEVKDRADIVDVIGRVVDLKKSGSSYMGLCPFHDEKTPSFSVQADKGRYHCFGCGVGGDVISFVMEREKLGFIEAVTLLAEELNIPLAESSPESIRRREKRDRVFEMNREAASYYMKILSRHKHGLAYLESRGIDREVIIKFGLGFAPSGGDQLRGHLLEKGYTQEEAHEANLLSYNETQGHYFDRFRNRIIFPIIDTRSRVLGFGGRVLGDGVPKYLNSSETPVFHKGTMLYGLNLLAKESDRSKILLVEGYMDVIALYRRGINYATASLGTALTRDQARLIKRYGKEVYICYDGDEAGINATKRAIQVLFQEDIRPRVVVLDGGMDPDDFVRARGALEFEAAMTQALPAVEFFIKDAEKNFNLSSTESFSAFLKEIARIISQIQSPLDQDLYLDKVAQSYSVSKEALRLEMGRSSEAAGAYQPQAEKETSQVSKPKSREETMVRTLLAYSLESLDFWKLIRAGLDGGLDLGPKWEGAFKSLDGLYEDQVPSRARRLEGLKEAQPDLAQDLDDLAQEDLDLVQGEKIIKELIDRIGKQDLVKRREALLASIRYLESLEEPTEEDRKRLVDSLTELTQIGKSLGGYTGGGRHD